MTVRSWADAFYRWIEQSRGPQDRPIDPYYFEGYKRAFRAGFRAGARAALDTAEPRPVSSPDGEA